MSERQVQYRSVSVMGVVLVAGLALAGCSSPGSASHDVAELEAAPATGQTVSGSGYSFAAPDGWSVPSDVSLPGVDLIVGNLADADGFADNINVVVSPAGRVSPDQVESAGVQELERAGALGVEIRDRVMVAGSESAHLSASLSSNGAANEMEQFYVSTDTQTYVVTFSFSPTVSEADRDELSESVLATWTWA